MSKVVALQVNRSAHMEPQQQVAAAKRLLRACGLQR